MVKLPILQQKIVKLTAAGTNDYLNSEMVKPGQFWEVTRVFVLNVDHTATDARVGPYNGADHFVLANSAIGTANVGVNFLGPFYIREGHTFRCHVVGATASDDLYFIFQYKVYTEE